MAVEIAGMHTCRLVREGGELDGRVWVSAREREIQHVGLRQSLSGAHESARKRMHGCVGVGLWMIRLVGCGWRRAQRR